MLRRSLIVIVLFILGLGAAFIWLLQGSRPPSDQSVVERFRRDKQHFERLHAMLSADTGVSSVAEYGVTTEHSIVAVPAKEAGMGEARFKEYLEILRKANASTAMHEEEVYRFPIAGWGFASKGWRLAIESRTIPPANIISSLDGFVPMGGGKWRQGYRHLEGNWYAWIIW